MGLGYKEVIPLLNTLKELDGKENISFLELGNNYMKGNFIASAVSDIRGQQQGFKNINNGENRWIEYRESNLNSDTMYIVIKNN